MDVVFCWFGGNIHQPYNHIHAVCGFFGFVVEELAQFVAGLMNAGRIYKNKLGILIGEDAKLTATRGLRAWRDGSNFLPKQCVEQSGLAHVGASDDCDKT